MSMNESQEFLRELDRKLWAAADKLRSSLDAAQYKHAVLGLIFLKYVSDAFEARREAVEAQLKDPKSEFFFPDASEEDIHAELEDPSTSRAESVLDQFEVDRLALGDDSFGDFFAPKRLTGFGEDDGRHVEPAQL